VSSSLPPPIRFTLPILALAFGSALLGVAIYRETSASYRAVIQRVEEHATLVGTQTAAEAEAESRRGNLGGALTSVRRMVSDRMLLVAALVDSDDSILTSTQPALEGRPISISPVASAAAFFPGVRLRMAGAVRLGEDRDWVLAIHPLLLPPHPGEIVSTRIGLVVAKYDVSFPLRAARAAALSRAAKSGLALVAFSALAWLLLHLLVTRRVQRLVAGTRQFATGVYDTPIGLSGSDELRYLSDAFDEMARLVKAETESLRESEARSQFLVRALDAAAEAILITDRSGSIQYVNSSFTEVSGYSAEESLGRTPRFMKSGRQDAAFYSGMWETILGGSVWRGEIVNRKKDGSFYTEQMTITPVPHGTTATHFIAVKEDVTARKAAEETLRRTQFAIEHSTDAILWLGPGGALLTGNGAACRLLGYEPQELSRLAASDIAPDLPPATWSRGGRSADGSQPPTQETRMRRKDGTTLSADVSVNLVEFEGGEYYCVNVRDITGRRVLEDQLRQAQKMEAVGLLAGGVAHDFNNLLTVVLGYSDLLLSTTQDPVQRASLEEIQAAGQRAGNLTAQLLAFSRKQMLAPESLDLRTVVARLMKMLDRLVGEHFVLATDVPARLGRVTADSGQIEQVLMNLVVNARDAMSSGGTITISLADVVLDADFTRRHPGSRAGEFVKLSVADAGSGMDPETLSRIFEPFFTTKEMGKGTGLGLSTTYGIVKQSGGFIWAESEPGSGTTFHVYLRTEKAVGDHAVPRAEAEAAPNGALPGGETILVVEDDESVLRLVRMTLQDGGYQILESHTAAEALEVARSYEGVIRLLLTDIIMPGGMTGIALAAAFREIRPGAGVLFMTGYVDSQSFPSDPALVLRKPFSPSLLSQRVREALDG
jgi:PAS domain S-box-containing protein